MDTKLTKTALITTTVTLTNKQSIRARYNRTYVSFVTIVGKLIYVTLAASLQRVKWLEMGVICEFQTVKYWRLIEKQRHSDVITHLDGPMLHKGCFKKVLPWEHEQCDSDQIWYKDTTYYF